MPAEPPSDIADLIRYLLPRYVMEPSLASLLIAAFPHRHPSDYGRAMLWVDDAISEPDYAERIAEIQPVAVH